MLKIRIISKKYFLSLLFSRVGQFFNSFRTGIKNWARAGTSYQVGPGFKGLSCSKQSNWVNFAWPVSFSRQLGIERKVYAHQPQCHSWFQVLSNLEKMWLKKSKLMNNKWYYHRNLCVDTNILEYVTFGETICLIPENMLLISKVVNNWIRLDWALKINETS